MLLARRLVEAGARLVHVNWPREGGDTAVDNPLWDTHAQNADRLQDVLCPQFDHTFPTLIEDLEARGLLDETLVLCISEHGRTPRLTNRPGGGREHWSRVYSGVLAGAGIARGRVVGKSDAIGADVADTPVSPKDILATSLYLLGVDPHTTVPDLLHRPVPVAGEGITRREFLA